jgi:quinol monooxygenase YgiN
MELFIFARFKARQGQDAGVAAALHDVVGPSRKEPGCLAINAYRSNRDPLLFYIHSRWVDEAAFETHALMPHTAQFIKRVTKLIDHKLEVTRAHPIV